MIDAHADAPSADLVAPGPCAQGVVRPKRRRRRWALAAWALVAGLIAFNAWWTWRESRPVPKLATINGWMSRERYHEAEPALREYLRRSPDDGEARTMLARILAARGDSLACARELHHVPFWWPTKAEAAFREGQTYMKIDRAREAEAAWRALVRAVPPHAPPPAVFQDASFELLKLYAVEDRWDDAAEIIWNAYDQAAPEDRTLWLIMRLRSELERLAHAETVIALRRYVAADPEDGEALRALARAELALGRPDQAARHFRACLEAHPDDARAWRDHLAMLLAQGEREAFLAALTRVPKTAEAEAQVWLYRGLAREWQGDMEGAARLYGEALARNPFVLECHHRLALADERLGRRAEAAEHHKQARQLREARGQLTDVFLRFFDAWKHGSGTARTDLPSALKRLASVCETLGWSRAADACIEQLSRAEEGQGG